MKLIGFCLIFWSTFLFGNETIVFVELKDTKDSSYKSLDILVNLDNLRNLKNKKTPILIELEDKKILKFEKKRLIKGKSRLDFTWTGYSQEGKAKVILTVKNGLVYGTIRCESGVYKIYPKGKGYKVRKVDKSKVIPFDIDTVTEVNKLRMPLPKIKETFVDNQDNSIEVSENSAPSTIYGASIASSTDKNITILAYYTQALEDAYGVNIEAMIQANIDLARDAYIDSDTEVNLQITAIKKVPEGSVLSTANTSDLYDLLDKLQKDGLVRYERQIYSADAITVFSHFPNNGQGCGLGSIPLDTSSSFLNAYSAVYIKPASEGGNYCPDLSFAHELGHNFGCFHDHDHVSSGTPMYSYAYGYDIVNEFGTIMSYDGPGISFFSNPNISYTSDNTGNTNSIGDVSTSDNARTIRENALKMADNSEQVSEVLESGDNINDHNISGQLLGSDDRDGYIMWLEGETHFMVDNSTYSNNPFYLNLYNEDTHEWISTFNDSTNTIILPRGKYRVVFSYSSDETGAYYSLSSIGYITNITTEYINFGVSPAIVNYLLN